MRTRIYYDELLRRRGDKVAWAIALRDLGELQSRVATLESLLRDMVREYMVEGEADWTRVSELIAEDARSLLKDFRRTSISCT